MRQVTLPAFLIAYLVLASCSSIECTQSSISPCRYEIADSLQNDTLTVGIIRGNGTDSIYLNRLVDADGFTVPVSYTQPTDVLLFHFTDTFAVTHTDTVRLSKKDIPHFDSVDCTPTYFHEIINVETTHHVIDSITILNPSITYEEISHLRIYLHPGH